MRKAKKSPYLPYPEPLKTRCGCKVSWYYYDNLKDAEECSKAARHNGEYQRWLGYDFGYCSPGSIRPPTKVGFNPELYEVCLP